MNASRSGTGIRGGWLDCSTLNPPREGHAGNFVMRISGEVLAQQDDCRGFLTRTTGERMLNPKSSSCRQPHTS